MPHTNEMPIKTASILSAILGGCNTQKRLKQLFKLEDGPMRYRIFSLRRAGLVKPFAGGRDFRLAVTDDGKRVVAGLLHGVRALTVQKVMPESKERA